MYIDQSVYPDLDELPEALDTPQAKADYIQRVCTAWDYGVHPDPETFALFAGWKEIFDRFPILTSVGYHAMRAWFGWDELPWPQTLPPPPLRWMHMDRLEGRGTDPCEEMI